MRCSNVSGTGSTRHSPLALTDLMVMDLAVLYDEYRCAWLLDVRTIVGLHQLLPQAGTLNHSSGEQSVQLPWAKGAVSKFPGLLWRQP